MKKILVYGLTKNMGGLEIFIAKTLLNMDMSGIEVHALVYEETIFFNELKEKGVIFHFVNRRGKRPLRNIKQVDRIFEKNNFDALWFNACTLTYITPVVLAKKYGVKTRAIHGHCTCISKGNLMRNLHNINKKRIGNYANLYLGCTSQAAEFLAPDNINVNKDYTVVKNAIELEKYEYSENLRNKIRNELNIDKDAFVIGNVGHLIDVKNQSFLINVFAKIYDKVKNSYLVIVGTGELEQDLKNLAKELNVERNVIFTGRRSDVNEVLNALDAFIMPSKFEGLPLSAVEAQASGLKTYLSNNISKDSELTDLVEFIDLENDYNYWAEKIVSGATSYLRTSRIDTLTEKGFSVSQNAKVVKEMLLK